jgi:Tfp pilus assembly PilM family ATPase
MFKKSNNSLLAIDLAPEAVRVLEVTLKKGVPTINSASSEALPDGNQENLPERHLAALERILKANKFKSRDCVAAISTNLVTTRSVIIDPSKPGTPDDQIKQTLQNILTFDAKDLLFDFWSVSEPNQKTKTYEVLVIACQRGVVHRYLDGFAKQQLACTHMDVAPCALASLFTRMLPGESVVGTVALGETVGYFAVVSRQRVLFWRPFEMPTQKNGEQAALERIGHEISKCVSHMIGSNHLESLAEIVVFGNNAGNPQFAEYLSHRFNLQVRAPSPFDWLPADSLPADVKTSLQAGNPSQYAAALGLALQPAGGSNG